LGEADKKKEKRGEQGGDAYELQKKHPVMALIRGQGISLARRLRDLVGGVSGTNGKKRGEILLKKEINSGRNDGVQRQIGREGRILKIETTQKEYEDLRGPRGGITKRAAQLMKTAKRDLFSTS